MPENLIFCYMTSVMQIPDSKRLQPPLVCISSRLVLRFQHPQKDTSRQQKDQSEGQSLIYNKRLVSPYHRQLLRSRHVCVIQFTTAITVIAKQSPFTELSLFHVDETIGDGKSAIPLHLSEVVIKPLECVANEGQAHLRRLLDRSA